MSKPTGRPPGQAPYIPSDHTREQIARMQEIGLTHDQMGAILGVSADTLERHYKAELAQGHSRMTYNVANNLYRMATGTDKGSVAAAIFWMKTKGRWRETNRLEHTGPDGGPIEESITTTSFIDPRLLTPEQRLSLKQIVKAVMVKPVEG